MKLYAITFLIRDPEADKAILVAANSQPEAIQTFFREVNKTISSVVEVVGLRVDYDEPVALVDDSIGG